MDSRPDSHIPMLGILIYNTLQYKSPGKYMIPIPPNYDSFIKNVTELGGFGDDCKIYYKCGGYKVNMKDDYNLVIKLNAPIKIKFYEEQTPFVAYENKPSSICDTGTNWCQADAKCTLI